MASPPDSSSAPTEDAQREAPADENSQTIDIGRVKVEDDKPVDGKKKKQSKKRSATKKRGTGFEGEFRWPKRDNGLPSPG
jgi:hypothetical protein